jgi:hypothetical protein
MKIQLAFYKDKGNFGDTIIRWWTRSLYSHVEMIIEDSWVSSSPSTGGVTILPLHSVDDSWEYVTVEVDGRHLSQVLRFIEERKDAEYDWWGLFLGNVFGLAVDDRNKFYCSEMMVEILKVFKYEGVESLVSSKTSPGELFKIILN